MHDVQELRSFARNCRELASPQSAWLAAGVAGSVRRERDDRERGRRCASTAWKHNVRGCGRVNAEAAGGGGAQGQP
jgi:hypothetical protein